MCPVPWSSPSITTLRSTRIVENFGAELIVQGQDFYDAQSYCDELVDSAGYYYVEQGSEPEILNGLGTMGLEILEDLPDVDVIICPIGGGSGCASLIKVTQAVKPEVEVIGVQAERAAAFYESWKRASASSSRWPIQWPTVWLPAAL